MAVDSKYLELQYKPDLGEAMERINAWYENSVIDRPPIQFGLISPRPKITDINEPMTNEECKNKWFDINEIIKNFEEQLDSKSFKAETFPVFWPNLGPVVYPAFFGAEIVFEKITSWSKHLPDWEAIFNLKFEINKEISFLQAFFNWSQYTKNI